MEIRMKKPEGDIFVEELNAGDCFMDCPNEFMNYPNKFRNIYIKTTKYYDCQQVLCVNLKTGACTVFSGRQRVWGLRNSYVMINEKETA